MLGTVLNATTVVAGGSLGLLLGSRLPGRVRETVVHGLGLVTLALGASLAIETSDVLVPLLSVVVGSVVGEVLDVERHLEGVGRWLERRTTSADSGGTFVRGFVTASLVYCVGPMTILGSLQDGLTGDYRILAVKALLDGVASVAFASAMGVGVLFAAVTVLVYQGAITLGATWARVLFTDPVVAAMNATGGLLLLGIGLRLLEIKALRVTNMLPALAVAPALVALKDLVA
ncbi:MAG TPA: DUF554 domain-containing protein [Chloroflexota bacterium]